MYIWNDLDQYVSAPPHNVKLYMGIIKHHTQSTKNGLQDISLFSAGGQSKGDSSEISMIHSMSLSSLHARLATAYKKKKSGKQH